jgi:integrase/recombinase XerD
LAIIPLLNNLSGGKIVKLSESWLAYKADKRIEGYSPQTLKAYELQTNLLIRFFGDINIESISTEQLKD